MVVRESNRWTTRNLAGNVIVIKQTYAEAAAVLVAMRTWVIIAFPSPTDMAEPGLKPNQPRQRIKTPSAAEVML